MCAKKSNVIDHERDCNECKELEKEKTFIETYRGFFKEDMREVVREEWNDHQNNTKRIDSIDKWMWKIEFKFGPVYLLTITVIGIIIYLFIDKFF